MADCPVCKAANAPDAKFCRSCGVALPAASVGAPVATPVVKKRNTGKIILFVVVGVCVLPVVLFLFTTLFIASKTLIKDEGAQSTAPVASQAPATPEERAQEGRLMCSEIEQQLTDFLKDTVHGIKCEPGAEDAGMIGLVIAYPVPILKDDDSARRNALFVAVSIAGAAMSKHPNTAVSEVYMVDSSGTSFGVASELAQQVYAKLTAHQMSENDGKEEVIKFAQKVKAPKNGQ